MNDQQYCSNDNANTPNTKQWFLTCQDICSVQNFRHLQSCKYPNAQQNMKEVTKFVCIMTKECVSDLADSSITLLSSCCLICRTVAISTVFT